MTMKSPVEVMQAVEITFSSCRTLPGHGCCKNTVCVRRVKPAIFFPYESLYFFRKNCASSGMSSAVPRGSFLPVELDSDSDSILGRTAEDIPLLAQFFLKKYNDSYGKSIAGLTRRTL